MFLLDTDHLVTLQRQSEPEYGRLRASMSRYSASNFYLAIISFHEQIMGANAARNAAKLRPD
jgi:hypothetical protein